MELTKYKANAIYNLAVAKYAATKKDIAEYEDRIKEYEVQRKNPVLDELRRLMELTDMTAARELISGDISYLKELDERLEEDVSVLRVELQDLNDQEEMLEVLIDCLKPEVMKV